MPSVEGNCKRGPLDGHGRISWSDKDKIGTWLVNLDLGRLLRHLLGNSKRMQVDSELNFGSTTVCYHVSVPASSTTWKSSLDTFVTYLWKKM